MTESAHPNAQARPKATLMERFRAGGWYFVVTIVFAGALAAIPFWHATARLGRPGVRRLALIYTVADVLLVVLIGLSPRRADGTSSNSFVSTVGGVVALVVMIAACVQLASLRRE